LKETRPLWPPQRGVGLRKLNLGKTNSRVSLHYSLAICFAPSLADSFLSLTLTRLVVVFIFENFSFALFTPPLGDFQPDSPVNYSASASGNSRRWQVRVGVLWCTGHVRWCTGHCPVAHRTVRCARPEVPSVGPLLLG
jgi:hypothetical protein